MQLCSVSGLILGLAVLAAALWMGHAPLHALLNPPAILIVFGGTLASTLVGFHPGTLRQAIADLFSEGSPESRLDPQATVQYMMDVVLFVRDEGILALQSVLPGIEIPFLRRGLELVLDNRSEKLIRESLSLELEVIYRRALDAARVFEAAGGFAPTMGIIGAVIGLMELMQHLQHPDQLQQGIASAFVATLYGVALSNLALLPLAGMLRRRAKDEWLARTLLLEAVLSVRSGEHPVLIRERLEAFVGKQADEEPRVKSYAGRPRASRSIPPEEVPLSPERVMADDFLAVPASERPYV